MKFEGKHAIVTGGALGLGRRFARDLAAAGASVLISDIRPEVDRVAAEISEETGASVDSTVGDVTSLRDVIEMVQAVADRPGHVDILVNNAGVVGHTDPVNDSLEKAADDFDSMVGANLKGPFLVGRAVIPLMVAQGGGDIVNISTDHIHTCGWPDAVSHDDAPDCGRIDAPRPGSGGVLDVYDASKWGLNGFTQAWAAVLRGSGVRVNSLCMGACDTPMLRALFGFDPHSEPPQDEYVRCLELADVSRVMIELLEEGPNGRSGDNVGIWVGHPPALPAPSPVLDVSEQVPWPSRDPGK